MVIRVRFDAASLGRMRAAGREGLIAFACSPCERRLACRIPS